MSPHTACFSLVFAFASCLLLSEVMYVVAAWVSVKGTVLSHTLILKLLVGTLFDILVCVFLSVCLLLIFITWAACPSSGRVSGVCFWRAVYIRRWGGPSPRLCHTILAKWHTDAGNSAIIWFYSHVFLYDSPMIKQKAHDYNLEKSVAVLLCKHQVAEMSQC